MEKTNYSKSILFEKKKRKVKIQKIKQIG